MSSSRTIAKALFLALLSSAPLGAAALTICIAPSEDAAYAAPPDGLGAPIGYLVSGCMTAVFNAGHIATDLPLVLEDAGAWEASGAVGLQADREGMIDYVVAVYADWLPSAFHKTVLLPETITYRLLRVSDGQFVASGRLDVREDSEDAATHPERSAARAGTRVTEACIEKLKALDLGGDL